MGDDDSDVNYQIDMSQFPPSEMQWYEKLGQRLGITASDALMYCTSIHVNCDVSGYPKTQEEYNGYFKDETPENREILYKLMKRMSMGEEMPDLDDL